MKPTDQMLESLLRECAVEPITVSGPGGQNRNRTYSGIRLTHLPTGLMVKATERSSQSANKSVALRRLWERLEHKKRKPKARVSTRPTKSSVERRLKGKSRRANLKEGRKRSKTWD